MTKPTDNHSTDPATPEDTPKGPEPVIPGQMSLDLLDGGALTASTLEWSTLEHTIGWDPETKTIDTAALEKAKDSSRKLAKQLLETVSAGPPADIHAWLMSVKESPTMPLATYWYQDADTAFFMGDYADALLMVYPELDLKAISDQLTQKIDDWKAASRSQGEDLTPPDVISNLTLADLLSRWTPDGDGTKQSVADIILEEIAAESGGQLPTITLARPKGIYYPTDPLDRVLWDLEREDLGKQLYVNTAKNSKLLFSVTLDDKKTLLDDESLKEMGANLNKPLTHRERRLYLAADALLEAGNETATASELYRYAGGYGDAPSKGSKDDVLWMMDDMGTNRLTISTKQESGANFPEYEYVGTLLPNEYIRQRSKVNGGTVDGLVHFLRPHLPLTQFSRSRRQGTTLPLAALRTPNKFEEGIVAMEDYLLLRITTAQSGSLSCDILWSAIYEAAGIADKSRTTKNNYKKYAERALDYWKGLPDSKKGTPGCKIIEDFVYFDKGYDPKRKINHTESGITIIPLAKQVKTGKKKKQVKGAKK